MSAAARLLGCSRDNVSRKIGRSPELQQLLVEILEESKDKWEAKLEQLGMEKDNVVATLALLNAKARDRGYNRTVNDINVNATVDHKHLHVHVLNEHLHKLQDDELDRQIAARRAALPENLRSADIAQLYWAGDQQRRPAEAGEREMIDITPTPKGDS